MHRIRQLTLPSIIALVTLAVADTASAGEPFHPFWDPTYWQPTFDYFFGYYYF